MNVQNGLYTDCITSSARGPGPAGGGGGGESSCSTLSQRKIQQKFPSSLFISFKNLVWIKVTVAFVSIV